MSYGPSIVQTQYPGMPMQQPVVVSGMPYQQGYYQNYPNQQPQNVKIVNQPNLIKNTNLTVTDYHIDYSIHSQMSSLKKLIEHAENLRNTRDDCPSPYEVRWRCVTDPFPSFWKFENDEIFNWSENIPSDFSVPSEQNLNVNYQKINEPRIQHNISTIQNTTIGLSNNPAYNSNAIPPQRSQSPQVSVVATNFIPQRQPSPEIVVNGIPPKNIITNPTNYNNGIPPNNIIIPNNNMQRNDFDSNNSNPINPVINNMSSNNYNNPMNPVGINNTAPNSVYNYQNGINNTSYNNPSNFVPNSNYNDHNNYNNSVYNNPGVYNNYNNDYNNNVYNKGNYPNYNNPNGNIGYRKTGYKPNPVPNNINNNNKKHNNNPRKRSRGGNQFTYKPGDQE